MSGWKSIYFIVFQAVVAPLLGIFVEWWWSIIVVAIGLLCIWIGATERALIKQRNEARALLLAKPKPIPLQNRKELRGAVASVEDTTMQLVNRKNELDKTDPQSPYLARAMAIADEAYDRWNEAMSELRRQYLIAGDKYESICVDLTGFIWTQVAIKMRQVKLPEGEKPIVIHDVLRFVGVLAGRVKETLRKIDEISGQALDKEGSQS